MTATTRRPTHALRRTLDALEDRCLMAASVAAVLDNGTLYVEGTEGPDRIVVREQGGIVVVDNVYIGVNGQWAGWVNADSVSRVVVNTVGGNDKVNLAPNNNQMVTQDAVLL